MISIEELRKIDPEMENLSDEELTKVREMLYSLGQLAFDSWLEDNDGSKNPVGVCGLINEPVTE